MHYRVRYRDNGANVELRRFDVQDQNPDQDQEDPDHQQAAEWFVHTKISHNAKCNTIISEYNHLCVTPWTLQPNCEALGWYASCLNVGNSKLGNKAAVVSSPMYQRQDTIKLQTLKMMIISIILTSGKFLFLSMKMVMTQWLRIGSLGVFHLCVSKTKDTCWDFRQLPPAPQSSIGKGQAVGVVSSYKYLGTMIENRLKFDLNTEMCKKGQHWLLLQETVQIPGW